jgi:hypothetical protein
VQARRETELLNSIGIRLRGIMPIHAESITAAGECDDDWADVVFAFTDQAGVVGNFDLNDNPAEASDEIAEALMELHALMAKTGQSSWNKFSITISKSGDLNASFNQDDES